MSRLEHVAFWRRSRKQDSPLSVLPERMVITGTEIIPEGLAPGKRIRLANLNAADLTKSTPSIQKAFLLNPDTIPQDDSVLRGFFLLGLVAVEIAEGTLTREEGLSELIAMETKLNEAIDRGDKIAERAYTATIQYLTKRGLSKIKAV